MDFLTQFLASIFDKFKIANPKVAAVVLLLLYVVVVTTEQGVVLGVFAAPAWLAAGIKFLSGLLMAVTGMRTVRYLSPEVTR